MTDEEKLVLSRLELAVGEASAVGEVEVCRTLWPLETDVAIHKEGGERSKEMTTLRRRVRDIVSALRLGYNVDICDSAKGYFFAADDDERKRFCRSRHRRGITSLVIESIIRKSRPLDVGLQQFFEFLRSEEVRRKKVAERQGLEFEPLEPREVVAAVAEKAKTFTTEDAETAEETGGAE